MDILSPAVVILLGVVLAFLASRDLKPRERRFAGLVLAAHIVSSFAQWAIVELYYGISDVHVYQEEGGDLARLLDIDFLHFAPEVMKLALHLRTELPFEAFGDGSSTGTMSAIAGIFTFFVGSSPLSLYLLAAFFAWYGLLAWYRVAREELRADDLSAAALGLLAVPSVVFWSSGFVKEALVVGFFGILGRSTHRLLRDRHVPALVGVVFGGVGVGVLKSYTLFAYILAVSVFLYARRAWASGGPVRIRLASLIVAAGVAVAGIAAMGSLFPEYSAGKVAETMAYNQEVWRQGAEAGYAGGSSIDIGSGEAKTIPEQLRFVPLALVNTLFRPVVFEAKNAPAMGGAIENAVLLLAVLSLLGGATRASARDALFRTPFLLASTVFVLVFAAGVGLATSNLGTLSRYRMPMIPFYATTVLVLRHRMKQAAAEATFRARAVVGSARAVGTRERTTRTT